MNCRKMRVLHVGKFYPPEKGGIETHVSGLCEALAAHADVSVLVANRGRRTVTERVNGIPVTRAGTLFTLSGAAVCPGMVRLIRRSRAELIHLHTPNPGAVLALLASGYRGPLIVSYHSDVVRQKALNTFFQPVMDRLLAGSAAIIATTAAYVEASPVLRRFSERCRIIPYGIEAEEMSDVRPEAVEMIRSRYPGPLVLGVGRMVPYKGFDYLIRAMKEVQGTLLLVGEGPRGEALKHLAAECGVEERVRFVGSVEDARPYYHAADIFVLPSVSTAEAFGIVQLEAMACGKPVINTDLRSSVPHVSPHQVSGLTVPCRDEASLASAINLVLQREDLRVRFGQAARRRVKEEFTFDKMTDSMLALYHELMDPPVYAATEASCSTDRGAAAGSRLSTKP
jgi:glycosyltransferase involved in cell wall biosynthesis